MYIKLHTKRLDLLVAHMCKVSTRETQAGTPVRPGVPFFVEPVYNVLSLGKGQTSHCLMVNVSVSNILRTAGCCISNGMSVKFLLNRQNEVKTSATHQQTYAEYADWHFILAFGPTCCQKAQGLGYNQLARFTYDYR